MSQIAADTVAPLDHFGGGEISATGPVYRGPGAPATGPMHHYTIEVYALDTMLGDLGSPAKAKLEQAMQGHILEKAELIGTYEKAKGAKK